MRLELRSTPKRKIDTEFLDSTINNFDFSKLWKKILLELEELAPDFGVSVHLLIIYPNFEKVNLKNNIELPIAEIEKVNFKNNIELPISEIEKRKSWNLYYLRDRRIREDRLVSRVRSPRKIASQIR